MRKILYFHQMYVANAFTHTGGLETQGRADVAAQVPRQRQNPSLLGDLRLFSVGLRLIRGSPPMFWRVIGSTQNRPIQKLISSKDYLPRDI